MEKPDLFEVAKLVAGIRGDYRGDSQKQRRKAIMLALTGQNLPVAKCGATVIDNALRAIFAPNATCIAHAERHIAAQLTLILNGQHPAQFAGNVRRP